MASGRASVFRFGLIRGNYIVTSALSSNFAEDHQAENPNPPFKASFFLLFFLFSFSTVTLRFSATDVRSPDKLMICGLVVFVWSEIGF